MNAMLAIVWLAVGWVGVRAGSGGCTMHDYLQTSQIGGACAAYNAMAPGATNGGFITAFRELPTNNVDGCGSCLQVTSTRTGSSTYVLVVDRGGAMGLDLSKTAIEAIDPAWATSGNTPCSWVEVAASFCTGAVGTPGKGIPDNDYKSPRPLANGRCGPDFDHAWCAEPQCCSEFGYCGTTAAHCNRQSIYKAGPHEVVVNLPGRCSRTNPYSTCPDGECCSVWGWCGTGALFCEVDNNPGYAPAHASPGSCPSNSFA